MRRLLALSEDWPVVEQPIERGRRRAARLRLSIPARVETIYDTRRCILVDLSRGGAAIALENPLRKGEDVVLQVAGIDQFGVTVRYQRGRSGGVNGIQFDEDLTDQAVIQMRHYAECLEAEQKRAFRREVQAWVNGG